MSRKFALVTTVFALVALAMASADAVGNIGAVNASATGTPPGGETRTITLGLGVQNRERLETGADGSTQVVFVDTSTMTVGHNSRVTIDKFVFGGLAGQQSVSLAKGALRFVGGSVSHNSGAEIKTPVATTAVRGGMVTVDTEAVVDGASGTMVLLEYGSANVRSSKESVTLSRPGYFVLVSADGSISEPKPSKTETVAGLNSNFVSATGQSGGVSASMLPNDTQAIANLSGLAAPNFSPWGGLTVIGAQWAGRALAQSRAQAVNQAVAIQTHRTIQQAIETQQRADKAAADAAAKAAAEAAAKAAAANQPKPANNSQNPAAFGNGFCVWGCVTPVFNQTGNYFTATFNGYGTFNLYPLYLNSQQTYDPTTNQTTVSASGSGPISIVFNPANGGPSKTNTYNLSLTTTYVYSGNLNNPDSNVTPTLVSGSSSGSLTLTSAGISDATLAGQSSDSFFLLSSPYNFSYTYP